MRRLVCAVALVAAVACFGDTEIDLRIKGQTTKTRSRETPELVVNSLDEVKAHYAEVRDLLPPTPFIMDGQWVVRLDADGPKTFPDRADAQEFFSPNGEYVLQVQQLKTREGWPGTQKEWLLGTDGRRYWERECPWSRVWVLASGRVIESPPLDREDDMSPHALSVVDLHGGLLAKQAETVAFVFRATECPAAGLLLFLDESHLTALDYAGTVAWRVPSQTLNDAAARLAEPLGTDPLGRGLCVLAFNRRGGLMVNLHSALTGEFERTLVTSPPPAHYPGWSPRGTMAPIATDGGIGLIDWTSGELLFAQRPGPEARDRDVRVSHAASVTASDSPARVAMPRQIDHVFDRAGRTIWRNYVASGSGRRLVLSADGMRLGTVLLDWAERGRGPTVHSVVVYDLPADGQAMRGL